MNEEAQAALSEFKQKMILLIVILQTGFALVLVVTNVVQTGVITDEIYSVLFQRVLIVLLELIRLIWF